MDSILPKIELPEIALPPMPSILPSLPSGKDFVDEASQTVNADLQQTLDMAVENARAGLVSAGEEIIGSFYERALALMIIFVVCLVGLLFLALIVKTIRDSWPKKKDSSDIPPQTA